ncbi:FixH family protein [Alkalihalobacillus sp. TS-13]|uniref:FixH family protein n=1 Tax=Alkalihalobacillus sp. TS-13 TaxID=2842455 RepID=UPI001C88002C|nr:FixH family protein [Alkalihalobacillus sp. TS-13]
MTSFKLFIPFFLFMLLLAACGGSDEHQGQGEKKGSEHEGHGDNENAEDSMKMLEVDLQSPETADKGETVTIKAMVMYGDEHVADANEVVFEVWKEGSKDDSEMIEATNDGEGMYSIESSFDEEGVYFVQSHVTARDMHNMPKKEIKVGE